MLSRDDSLINLAMLPILDTVDVASGEGRNDLAAAATGETSLTGVATADVCSGGDSSNAYGDDYNISAIFSRDNSLINLLATVDAANESTSATVRQQQGGDHEGWDGAYGCGDDMFGFVDFQT